MVYYGQKHRKYLRLPIIVLCDITTTADEPAEPNGQSPSQQAPSSATTSPKHIRPEKIGEIPAHSPTDKTNDSQRMRARGRGCVVNFSLGGLAIVSNISLIRKTEVNIDFNIDNSTIRIHGSVQHGKQVMGDLFRYGITFVKMNLFERMKLVKKLKDHMKKHGQAYWEM